MGAVFGAAAGAEWPTKRLRVSLDVLAACLGAHLVLRVCTCRLRVGEHRRRKPGFKVAGRPDRRQEWEGEGRSAGGVSNSLLYR